MLRAVLLNDTRSDLHHGCELVFRTLSNELKARGITLSVTSPPNADWWKIAAVSSAIGKADLVIVNGEGTLHHDAPAGRKLLQASSYCQELGVPSALINCTWAENSSGTESMALKFDLISVRDRESARQLDGLTRKVIVVPDLSLGSLKPDYEQGEGIGYGDSVLRDVSVQLLQRCRENEGTYLPIQFPGNRRHAAWKFVRSMFGKQDVFSPLKSARYADCRITQLKHAVNDTDAFVSRISDLACFVTGRYHGICTAIGVGTPFIALTSNSHKVASLLEDAGLGHREIPLQTLGKAQIRELAHWTPRELRSLNEFLEAASRARNGLFDRLASMARSKNEMRRPESESPESLSA